MFRFVDPEQFHARFITFMARLVGMARRVIACDGKTLRRSIDSASATHRRWYTLDWLPTCGFALSGFNEVAILRAPKFVPRDLTEVSG